jgi:hypothetical protein
MAIIFLISKCDQGWKYDIPVTINTEVGNLKVMLHVPVQECCKLNIYV